MQFFQNHLLKWLFFHHWMVLTPLKINWSCMWQFISRDSIFYPIVCIPLPYSFDYRSFVVSFEMREIGKCKSFNFVFFLKFVFFFFAICDPLRFHIAMDWMFVSSPNLSVETLILNMMTIRGRGLWNVIMVRLVRVGSHDGINDFIKRGRHEILRSLSGAHTKGNQVRT